MDPARGANLLPLDERDLARAAALSALIGWNQTVSDWQLFQRHGSVRALDDGDPAALAGTAATLAYGPDLAWVSMVLVRPDRRRQGLATALMRWAVENLRAAGIACIALDATPAGREVYRRLGFRDAWAFARWQVPPGLPPEPGVPVRPLAAADWPAVLALDASVFGAPRAFLLRSLVGRAPGFVVADDHGGLRGMLLARDGLRGPQLGPLFAADAATARALLAAAAAALPGAVIDLRNTGVARWLAGRGGDLLRPFTRMTLGVPLPGDTPRCIAVAGPEFG